MTEKTNASATVLYHVLGEATGRPIDWRGQGTSLTLGLDEHSYRGRHLVTTLTNITERTLLGVAGRDTHHDVRQLLAGAETADVAEVCKF